MLRPIHSASSLVPDIAGSGAGHRMYDHNQTLVPDSFMALHSVNGRAVWSREETEARYATCEDLALHTAALLEAHGQGPDDADEALRRCGEGLRTQPMSILAVEVAWVLHRIAELRDWPEPEWLAEPSRSARA
ncbi:MAG: hypothetical protein ABI330_16440 [Caldimonas sp.]